MSNEIAYAKLAVEHWRLIRILERLVDRLPIEAQTRVEAQLRFAAKKLVGLTEEQGMQLEVFEGRTFEAGLPIVPINGDEFTSDSDLCVDEMLEPAVLSDGRILQLGRATLKLRTDDASRD